MKFTRFISSTLEREMESTLSKLASNLVRRFREHYFFTPAASRLLTGLTFRIIIFTISIRAVNFLLALKLFLSKLPLLIVSRVLFKLKFRLSRRQVFVKVLVRLNYGCVAPFGSEFFGFMFGSDFILRDPVEKNKINWVKINFAKKNTL